jgi:hypothetical protein
MPDRKLIVQVIGDTASFERGMARSAQATNKFATQSSASLGRFSNQFNTVKQATRTPLFAGLAGGVGALGTQALIGELRQAVDVTVNLGEQTNKVRQIFRASAPEIEAWGETTADSLGIANDQALEAVGTFGALFAETGRGAPEIARLAKDVVGLAADLASFNNTTVDDALIALRSGLSGEIEPLRRFQVFLTEAAVAQRALEDTGKSSAKQLTQGEKIMARYEIIVEKTAAAQGDFARTSQDQANQQRILAARLRNVQADIGKGLLPVVILATDAMQDGAIAAAAFADALEKIGGVSVGGGLDIAEVAKEVFLNVNPATASIHRFRIALNALRDDGDVEVDVTVRTQDDIITALNTIDAIRQSVAGGINLDLFFKVHVVGLNAATSEIESFRSNAIRSLGDVVDAQKRATLTPTEQAEQRNTFFDAAIGRRISRSQDQALRAQLAELERIAAAISDRIAKTKDITRRLNLEDQLLAVQRQAGQVRQQLTDQFVDSLQLNLERAQVTKGVEDDLRALARIEEAIRKRIAAEGRTIALERQLLDVQRERTDLLRQQREEQEKQRQAQAAARQGRQFRALGLTAEGEQPVGGVPNLLKRAGNLKTLIKGTVLDTAKTRSQLERIINVLSGEFGKVGREVRAAIEDMLDTIAGSLKDRKGPLTKASGLDTSKILEGLGLTPEQIRELRGRLSKATTPGTAPAGRTVPPPVQAGTSIDRQPLVVESHTTINLDGEQVAKVVTKAQQKNRRRNPPQKRGLHRGGV